MAQYRFEKSIACLRRLSPNLNSIQRTSRALKGGRRFLQTSNETKAVRRVFIKATFFRGKKVVSLFNAFLIHRYLNVHDTSMSRRPSHFQTFLQINFIASMIISESASRKNATCDAYTVCPKRVSSCHRHLSY